MDASTSPLGITDAAELARAAAALSAAGRHRQRAVECEKVLARNADDPDMILTVHEQEAIRVVRAVLARVAEKERDAR